MCLLWVGRVRRIELTGVDDWSVNQVLSFNVNGSPVADCVWVRVDLEGGVENSRNALTGFEKLE